MRPARPRWTCATLHHPVERKRSRPERNRPVVGVRATFTFYRTRHEVRIFAVAMRAGSGPDVGPANRRRNGVASPGPAAGYPRTPDRGRFFVARRALGLGLVGARYPEHRRVTAGRYVEGCDLWL